MRSLLTNKTFLFRAVICLMIASIALDVCFPGARTTRELESQSRTICHIVRLGILSIMLCAICFNYTLPRMPAVRTLDASLFILAVFFTYYAVFASDKQQIVTFSKIIYWITGYFFFRVHGHDWKRHFNLIFSLALSLFVFCVWYYVRETELRSHLAGRFSIAGSNAGWTLLYVALTAAVCARHKAAHYLSLIALMLVTLSLKRGAIIAEAAAIITLIVSTCRTEPDGSRMLRLKARRLIIPILVFLAVLIPAFYDSLSKRFTDTLEDNGSGRSVFYSLIWDRWNGSDLFNWFFGFGLWTVPDYLGMVWINNIFAHSDWLEILHDHGIAGILVFIIFIVAAVRLYACAWKLKHHSLGMIGMVLSVFFVKSVISGNVMFSETIYAIIPLACAANQIDSERNLQR